MFDSLKRLGKKLFTVDFTTMVIIGFFAGFTDNKFRKFSKELEDMKKQKRVVIFFNKNKED